MRLDTENAINKIRWERWRAKQKAEREKTCFYCWEQWNQWSNWSDVPPTCQDSSDASIICKYIEIKATLYKSSEQIKVHWYAACCMPDIDKCGSALFQTQKVTVKVCQHRSDNSVVCEEKTHTYSGAQGSGDDFFDVDVGPDINKYSCCGTVECYCFAFTGSTYTSCDLYP